MGRAMVAHEVAARIGTTEMHVRQLAREGLIPSYRIGRLVRFDSDQVEEWIRGGGAALPGGWRREPTPVIARARRKLRTSPSGGGAA